METKQMKVRSYVILLMSCLGMTSYPSAGYSAPLRLTAEGATGNPNDGFGMSLEEMRKRIAEYSAAGEVNKLHSAGQKLCYGLKKKTTDAASVQDYVGTCIYFLGHTHVSLEHPYGTYLLVDKKGDIGLLLVGGDYLHYLPDGKYQETRSAIVDSAIHLIAALRSELKEEPPIPSKPSAGIDQPKKLHEQQRLWLEANLAILSRKKIPDLIKELEVKFVGFIEQEYRRVPPEKGEMEQIIARADLPKESSERLKALIAR